VTDSTLQNPEHTYSSPGTYSVNLTVTGTAGSDSEIKLDYITVSAPPVPPTAAFTSDTQAGDAPLTVHFTDQSTGTGPLTYAWDFTHDGSTDSTLQNPSFTYSTAGTFTVSLTVSGPGGSDTETKAGYITAEVPPPQPPVAGFTASPRSGTEPLAVTFTDTSTNTPTSWTWKYRNATADWTEFATTQNPAGTFPAGTYDISLTAANAAGSNEVIRPGYISVSEIQPIIRIPKAQFALDAHSGRAPLTVTFTDRSRYSPASYHWDFGDGVTSDEQNPVHTYTKAGAYQISLTATNSAGSDSVTRNVHVRSK
jgi:PKD repeat protein